MYELHAQTNGDTIALLSYGLRIESPTSSKADFTVKMSALGPRFEAEIRKRWKSVEREKFAFRPEFQAYAGSTTRTRSR